MKNIRLLLLLFCLCFLTGCTAEYNLEITSSQFKESTTISMNQSEFQKFTSDSNNQYFNMYYDDENDQASEGTQKPLPNVKYYDYSEVPFEIIIANSDINNKILLSVFSTS